mmetsp:Transcript_49540/g.56114  ORF Transcript_49540/g.56114 Transcript_49540/m.56114 type:complete len:90 (-) Transcript_49540:78-347(-)
MTKTAATTTKTTTITPALSKVLGVTMTVKAMVMGNGDKDQQQQQLPPPSQKHLTLLDIRSNCSGHYECGDGSRTGWRCQSHMAYFVSPG